MFEVTSIFENVLLMKERIQNNPDDDSYEDILNIIDIIKNNNSNTDHSVEKRKENNDEYSDKGKKLLLKQESIPFFDYEKRKIKKDRDLLIKEASANLEIYKETVKVLVADEGHNDVKYLLISVQKGADEVFDVLQDDRESVDGVSVSVFLIDATIELFITTMKKLSAHIVNKLMMYAKSAKFVSTKVYVCMYAVLRRSLPQ